MATLRSKRKLAAVSRETPESTRNSQLLNTLDPEMAQEYISQVSEKIEGRVIKKFSKEFRRTESRILGALSKLDEFLLNPQVRTCSVAVPGASRNSDLENREPTEDRSLNDPCPKVVYSSHHSGHLNNSEAEEYPHIDPNSMIIAYPFQWELMAPRGSLKTFSMSDIAWHFGLLNWFLHCAKFKGVRLFKIFYKWESKVSQVFWRGKFSWTCMKILHVASRDVSDENAQAITEQFIHSKLPPQIKITINSWPRKYLKVQKILSMLSRLSMVYIYQSLTKQGSELDISKLFLGLSTRTFKHLA